jgi:radical SAM protein with 4Fe4S-binding SPASM domain
MQFSLGIGLTNRCNYNCSHCYSREDEKFDLAFDDVKKICDNLDVEAVNFGTGESGLHKDFHTIVEYFGSKGIKMALTTNGHTTSLLSDDELKLFNDIDFSLDFPDTNNHDSFRGLGATQNVLDGLERCRKNDVEASFACAMMKDNYVFMDKMVEKARELGVNLRVNLYKPVYTDKHTPTYDEFWEGVDRLFGNSKIVSCSEPVVNAVIGNKTLEGGAPCGKRSLRIHPDGKVVGCVYYKKSDNTIWELIENKNTMQDDAFEAYLDQYSKYGKIIPEFCADCESVDTCKGGCTARRMYSGLDMPDQYCYRYNNREKPKIDCEWGDSKDLVHSDYLCTIIVQ